MTTIRPAYSLRGLELRHLVAMDAVARHRSFNAAAGELGYTQSAVSQQVADLERIAGTRVFERSAGPRQVELTEAGRVLLAHARAMLARMEALGADLDALAEGAVGDLRVGTFQSAASRLLPDLLAAFRRRWPRIAVSLFESGSHDEIDAGVERGTLDIAFTHPPVPPEAPFEYVDLLSDPYVLVVGAEHQLAGRADSPPIEVLGQIDLVGYRVCRAHAEVERFLRSRGIEPRFVFRAEDNALLQGLAGDGVGAAIMPLLAVDLRRKDCAVVDLADRIPRRRIGLVWHRDRYQTPAARGFVELAGDIAARLVERTDGLALGDRPRVMTGAGSGGSDELV